ncbi:MAG: hypothetical protein IJ608_02260 [Lachnospiraceae bacterium]|nr:hypothetical protein [Lachnospiraceae bacterium]
MAEENPKENKEETQSAAEPLVVEGYVFYTKKDAELAELEKKKVDAIMERINFKSPETVLAVYEKAVADRVFKTPVGLEFLKELRDYLYESPNIANERISPIVLQATYDTELRKKSNPARYRIQPSSKSSISPMVISVILNILLVLAVLAMFVITFNSDQPTILNYERVITDKYAAWEENLTEREAVIRQKERELLIEGDNSSKGDITANGQN